MREVLTVDEVAALLQATPSPTYKAMFRLSYASGLRLAEVLAVEVSHLDPGNGVLHVHAGKGAKDRDVTLGPRLLNWSRDYLREVRPPGPWLFVSPRTGRPPSARSVQKTFVADRLRAGITRPLPALPLDVTGAWDVGSAEVLACVNMIHVSPWAATLALFDGAARLGPRVVYLYGPYKRGGRHTAPSNEAFEGWLKAQNPAYGVRELEAVVREAEARGFVVTELVEMPANNLSVVLGRAG
jgi:hypothetical protein